MAYEVQRWRDPAGVAAAIELLRENGELLVVVDEAEDRSFVIVSNGPPGAADELEAEVIAEAINRARAEGRLP